jgi:hypothetical protein
LPLAERQDAHLSLLPLLVLMSKGFKERGFLPMICEKGYRNKPLTEE